MDDQTKDGLITLSGLLTAELSFGDYTDDQKKRLGKIADFVDGLIDADQKGHNRFLLRQRLNRMVERVCEEVDDLLPRDVHSAWMREGGKSQTRSTVEELQDKVDWLYENWPDVFRRDTRDWVPKSERQQSFDPCLSRVEPRGPDE